MDANGQRCFQLADATDLVVAEGIAYDERSRRLRLVSTRRGPAPRAVEAGPAFALLEHVPSAIDRFGTFAWWDVNAGRVLAAGALEEPDARERQRARRGPAVPLYPPLDQDTIETAPTDVCLGGDGVIAIVLQGVVKLIDARERFLPVDVPFDGFEVWRLGAADGFGFAALHKPGGPDSEVEARRIARLQGAPAPDRAPRELAPGVLRPCRENPNPPVWKEISPPAWAPDETPVAIAMSPDGAICVLTWLQAGQEAYLHVLSKENAAWAGPYRVTAGLAPDGTVAPASYAMSVAFVGSDRCAILVPGLFVDAAALVPRSPPPPAEALVFAWPVTPSGAATGDAPAALDLLPLGEFYPLTDPSGAALTVDRARPFFRGPRGEIGYAASAYPYFRGYDGERRDAATAGPRQLSPLSKRSLPLQGKASLRTLSALAAGTVWHRLYIEATIPDGAGARLWLAATDLDDAPPESAFFPHDLGLGPNAPGFAERDVPRAAFVRARSEIPFEQGLLGCDPEPPHTGLFTVLIQRAGCAVRSLAGRHLHVKLELFGTGSKSPEIAAIRAYSPRFSYVDEYLPELYAETALGPDGDARAPATGSDFLGRLLALVESELTPMEDRVAAAYLLSDPQKTPDGALDWLASWVGLTFDATLPAATRRALLRIAPELSRWHGTLRGLGLALDAVTGGDVAAGKIVIVEDYRMRRVFATILGAHLEDENDPLLPGGLIVSGNSYVGDTLFVGEGTPEELTELAAFYRADPEEDAAERELGKDRKDPLDPFYERFAHRVTVLVHDELPATKRALIERAIAIEAPAHVEVRVASARWPFLTGVASLVGIDSYLGPKRGLSVFRLDTSSLGEKDVIMRPPSLDPRLEGWILEQKS